MQTNIPTTKEFLKEIDRFLREADMDASTFGFIAVGNRKFLPRLREGLRTGKGDIKLFQVHRCITFMKRWRRVARARVRRAEAAE